jgi:hypothetical protein
LPYQYQDGNRSQKKKPLPRYFPRFEPDAECVTLMRLWGEDCEDFIAGKLKDKAKYDERIRAIFAEAEAAAQEKHE